MTIKEQIDELVRRFGHYRTGHYIIERALAQALYRDDGPHLVTVDGKLCHETPGGREASRREMEALERLNQSAARRCQ